MRFFRIRKKEDSKILAQKAGLANNFFSRLKGLLGTKGLPQDEGMILDPCKSVHTFFMHYDLDVIFIDESNTIIGCEASLKPNRFSSYYGKARKAIELPAGTIEERKVRLGQKLEFQPL